MGTARGPKKVCQSYPAKMYFDSTAESFPLVSKNAHFKGLQLDGSLLEWRHFTGKHFLHFFQEMELKISCSSNFHLLLLLSRLFQLHRNSFKEISEFLTKKRMLHKNGKNKKISCSGSNNFLNLIFPLQCSYISCNRWHYSDFFLPA